MKIVIRAGGSGTRLWPMSRADRPKQFLPLFGRRSLLEEKYQEIRPLLRSPRDLYVSVGPKFIRTVKRLLPHLPKDNIIVEPVSRNTGPAIGLESTIIRARAKKGEDPVIASLTVDDVFHRTGRFRDLLRSAEAFLKIKPHWALVVASTLRTPDTGLSYVQIGKRIGRIKGQTFYRAARWVEKPKQAHLTRIMKSPEFFAHTGLYLWRASTILDYFTVIQPDLARRLKRIGEAVGTGRFPSLLKSEYQAFPHSSIEELITRHISGLGVAAADLGWSDTGKWYLIHDLLPHDAQGNVVRGDTLTHYTEQSLVFADGGRLVATVGLKNMIVVDSGDAVLVLPKAASSEVKEIVRRLAERRRRLI